MFRKIFVSVFVVITLLATPLLTSAAETKTVTLDVPGMTCKFCPITIRKALKKVPGVIDAKADFDSKTATVTFDPDKTSVKTLIQTTANAGYPSTVKQQ